MMKKNQVKVGNYVAPQIEIVSVKTTCHMLDTSYPSQHNPATPGGTVEEEEDQEAKKGMIFDSGKSSFWND
ncbi:hypothetical protein [Segatella buccae]|uniref:hypothetical protein n=1 Tax=Segatella buccae TaxID=28126 RepID=UPI0028D8847B|nr:hypothetical protein [Segatella buccae]